MRTGTIAFLCGIVAVQQLAELPAPLWPVTGLLISLVFLGFPASRRFGRVATGFAAGFCWACLTAGILLADRLPAEFEGVELRLSGEIRDLPAEVERATRFDFQANQLLGEAGATPVDWRLRLKWYGEHRPSLLPGQRWELTVKLKRPHGLANPGGFDYEQWLFANRYSATGYVRKVQTARLADTPARPGIDVLRQHLAMRIGQALVDHPRQGIIRALAIGDRGQMSDADWKSLTRTGTNHLVAISGLHIGLVAGFVFWLVNRGVRFLPGLCLRRPSQDYAAIAALIVAILYAALAGFSIPTQRALIMISVFMLAQLGRRRVASVDTLCLALLLVLIRDPLSVLAPGFWLSFVAVAVIFASLGGQIQAIPVPRQWSRLQLAISIGLLPLLILFFGRVSLVSPLANLMAIPWVSFVSVPLVFVAMLLSATGLELPWQLAALSLDGLFLVLDWLSDLPLASVVMSQAPGWTVLPACLGMLIFFLPRGFPGRWMGLIGLLPMLLLHPQPPASGAMVYVLDVGQGLSMVVRTQNHTLVYDTGPMFGSHDAGSAVLLPFLHSQAIRRIDRLVVSHGDHDHNGGTASLLEAIPVASILAGQPEALPVEARQCREGMEWQWDEVNFAILSPGPSELQSTLDNNHSCVLRISTASTSLLISGDIEAAVEHRLLDEAVELRSDVLLVPHHGSKSSSTAAFINAVRPDHVIYTVGYRNRYQLPNPAVVARYGDAQAYRTDQSGMLTVRLDTDAVQVSAWREQRPRYWYLRNNGFPRRVR